MTNETDPIQTFELLITADEGFVAFENLILDAQDSVIGGFRVFDLTTKLHGERAKAIGTTWFDLLLDALNRGVSIEITVTDFDPVAATLDHRRSWMSARQFAGLNELSTGAQIKWSIATHAARVGVLARTVLQVKSRAKMAAQKPDELSPGLKERMKGVDLPLVPTTHHHKLAVIDGKTLYIGGLDLNDRRYDTWEHDRDADQTWQDIQAIVTGPVVDAAERHLKCFQSVTAGEVEPSDPAPGFLRTLSTRRTVELTNLGPREYIHELEEAHLALIEKTEGPIYLETQFFRHKALANALAKAAENNAALTCTLVLPAAPEDVAFEGNRAEDAKHGAQLQMDCIDIVTEAFGKRVAIASPARPVKAPPGTNGYARLFDAPIIYVHSKLSLFGMHDAILSSANLNGRSMKWDTEAGIHLTNPDHIRTCWNRALKHWLHDVPVDPNEDQLGFVEWLNEDLARNRAAIPSERKHFLLPYPMGREADLASPLPGVPDAMV